MVLIAGVVICRTGYAKIPQLHPSVHTVMIAELSGVVGLLVGTVFFATCWKNRVLHIICARGLVSVRFVVFEYRKLSPPNFSPIRYITSSMGHTSLYT